MGRMRFNHLAMNTLLVLCAVQRVEERSTECWTEEGLHFRQHGLGSADVKGL